MSKSIQHVNAQELRRFIPLTELTHENLIDVSKKAVIEKLSKGRALFKAGDTINQSFYLLSGEVKIVSAGSEKVVAANTPQARYPLDHHNPRLATVTARTDVHFCRIDNDLLDILLTWDQNAGYMVNEIDAEQSAEKGVSADKDDRDWMTQMLRSSIFHRIPPSNIQAIFMHMEPMPVRAGEVIIQQGDEGDYYYHLTSGRAVVTHTGKSGKVIKLANLGPGQGFGEEALISNSRRNANITMLTDGSLMRLAKEHFEKLLKSPVLQTVDYQKARAMVKDGALLLDVRLDSEHRNASIRNSLNIPLYLLRIKAKSLDPDKTYIVYCDTGRRSSSAAYLLSERGFDAYVLDGGLMAIKQQA
ncbi:cyclic nucleotide-binding domain-containing protein [Thiohalomonas denitrificans]|uniref:Cyclic nucleotide-binding domain-containing protein n=1 Tax=Thiohalomonas denitrificans TaxID=415747 RepID=A0A1G5QB73_9GAMM|nr:cyclic nucleotide-binding domain-containing protein [Thiohalomonas denitrificans]SCZ59113.1 Cyclic nucleotide-binding domain-containing protein [Thiohalomonas denitrificans]